MLNLFGKRGLITGATIGIGKATAVALLQRVPQLL